jgi:signal transduction histidine kinase
MRVKFRTQLTLGVIALIAITSCIGVLAAITLYVTNSRSHATTRQVIDDLAVVQAVRVRAQQVVSAARGYLLAGDVEFREQLEAREEDLERSLRELRQRHQDPAVAAQLAVVEQRLLDYSQATARAARQRGKASVLSGIELTFERLLEPRQRALDEAVTTLVSSERAKLDREAAHSTDVLRTFSIALLFAWCAGTGLSITLAVIVVRRSTAQFRRVKEAEAVAEAHAAARKQLLDIVAHDLRSPLNAIVLGLEVAERQRADVPQLVTVKNAAARMQRLVEDLLDVSRAQMGGLELIREQQPVGPLLDGIVGQFQAAAERAGVRLRTEASPALAAYVDRDRLFQILANLLGNAIRHGRRGDEVVVRACEQPSGAVQFSVSDHGPGIPREELGHLFDAYTQGPEHGRRGRLGLGLYISKKLVEAHGGHIAVDSTPGEGTTFSFEIPPQREPIKIA